MERISSTAAPEARSNAPAAAPAGLGGLIEEGSAFVQLAGLDLDAMESNGRAATHAPGAAESFPVVVIGAGQSGLSVGYHLSRLGIRFVILERDRRIGDVWRSRWDSLRLFTPARFDGLDGMRFPAGGGTFPARDQMADYLEAYAARFALPVRTGVRVTRVEKRGGRFLVHAGERRFEADHVVIAMSSYQDPRVPAFGRELDPEILQLHSSAYRNPGQLRPGDVLVAGAGNSGAEIALELARAGRTVWLAGRDTGHVPFRVESPLARTVLIPVLFRILFHRVFTLGTPIGRRVQPRVLRGGALVIRVKPRDLATAGVRRTGRVAGARDGQPVLADGRALEVANVVWCTGFHNDFSWIALPVFDEDGRPVQVRGRAVAEPGLHFVGLEFLYALSSTMIHGAGRDARYVAGQIAAAVRVS